MFKVGDKGKTRNGMDYRVICVDVVGNEPVVALLADEDGIESSYHYHEDGCFYGDGEGDLDLIKEPVREVRYAPAYDDCSGCFVYPTPESAISSDYAAYQDRAYEMTLEDGKPVEARIVFVGDGK